MSDSLPVYEIDVTKKYILQTDRHLSALDRIRFHNNVREWLDGDNPFLLLEGNIRLVKVDEAENYPPISADNTFYNPINGDWIRFKE